MVRHRSQRSVAKIWVIDARLFLSRGIGLAGWLAPAVVPAVLAHASWTSNCVLHTSRTKSRPRGGSGQQGGARFVRGSRAEREKEKVPAINRLDSREYSKSVYSKGGRHRKDVNQPSNQVVRQNRAFLGRRGGRRFRILFWKKNGKSSVNRHKTHR